MNKKFIIVLLKIIVISCVHLHAQNSSDSSQRQAQQGGQELAKQLQNPVANLISIPFQSNFEFKTGEREGFKYTLNFQPVIPFSLGKKWNLITRTIVPVVSQIRVIENSSQAGLSDILFSAFFSPEKSKITWGIGPALLFPSATNSFLGGKKWAAGPTAILLKQSGPVTVGILINHLWSYAGEDNRSDMNSTFYQPFLSYVNKSHTTFSVSSESTHDLENNRWTVNIIPAISQLTKLVNLPVNLQLGAKYYFAHPDLAPKWGMRAAVVAVIPG